MMFVRVIMSLVAVYALALMPSTVLAQPGGVAVMDEVSGFSVDMAIQKDDSVLVSERVQYTEVQASGKQMVRTLSGKNAERGADLEVEISDVSVRAPDGSVLEFTTTKEDGGVVVSISDDVSLGGNVHDYVVSYVVRGAVRRTDGAAYLRWNATGLGWTVPIRRSSVTVRLSDSVKEVTSKRCLTGEVGGALKDCVVQAQAGRVFYAANGPIIIDLEWSNDDTGAVAGFSKVSAPWYVFVIGMLAIAFFYGAHRRRA